MGFDSQDESGRRFSYEFRETLRDKRLSLFQVARDAGMEYSYLWQVKNSLILPGRARLRRICKVLGWDYEEACRLYPGGKPKHRGRPRGSAMRADWDAGQKRFGEIVREWRRERSTMDDNDMCQAAHMSFGYLKRMERGKHKMPSYSVIRQVARALGKKSRRLVMLKGISYFPPEYRREVVMALLPDEKELIEATQEA